MKDALRASVPVKWETRRESVSSVLLIICLHVSRVSARIFLSRKGAEGAKVFMLSTDCTDYTENPRDPRDPWRQENAPHGNCFICEITLNKLWGIN